jgi:DNA-binding transcriptional ArsR family regulator
MNTRHTKDGSWCWENKAARRLIRDAFDATNNVTTALATYSALCEIASDKGRETFTTTHAWIQRLSGVSPSTIKKHLAAFADLKLVYISTPALRVPSTYMLLSLANDCTALANGELALANSTSSAPLATSEESKKKERRKSEELAAPSASAGGSAEKIKAPRARNPHIDALVAFDGSNPATATRPAFSAAAKALTVIKEVCPDATPQEIARRAANYRTRFAEAVGSGPNALAKHWDLCRTPRVAAAQTQPQRHYPLLTA